MKEGIEEVRKKEIDKRAQRREFRKEKRKHREEEQKLPWEERKERLQKRKQKERTLKRMKLTGIIFTLVLISIIAVVVSQNLPESQDMSEHKRPGGRGGGNFNLDSWEVVGNVSMPENPPTTGGMVEEILGEYSFAVMSRDETKYTIEFDVSTDIFLMDRETSTIYEASSEDISEDSRTMIWGVEQSDGSWFASDIGIMNQQ